MRRFPGQFLRRTKLIKRSPRQDDQPTWWCPEPLQFLVEQQGIPAVATPVPGSRFPDRLCWFMNYRRRGSPRRSVLDYRPATTMTSSPDLAMLEAIASGMPAGTSAVNPAVAATGGSAGGSGISFTPPRPLADLVSKTVRRVLPGADAFLPRRHDERTGLVDQDRGSATPLAMADLDTALSTLRESLLADVSRVIAASPAGSAQDPPCEIYPWTHGRATEKGSHGVTVVPRRHRRLHLPRRHRRQPILTTTAWGAKRGPAGWRSSSARTIALRASWTTDRTAYGTVTRPTGRRRPERWDGRPRT